MKQLLADLDRFWFDRRSPVAFGLFRILVGILALLDLAINSLHWSAYFTERGLVPQTASEAWMSKVVPIWYGSTITVPRINLLMNVTDERITLALYLVAVLAALLSAIGLFSRIATVTLAICYLSLHHRSPVILHGGDVVIRLCILYLAIGPAGAAVSLDRWIARRRNAADAVPKNVSMWAQRVVAYNCSLVYFTTVWLKWLGNAWREGDATWYTARLAEFKRFPVPDFIVNMPFVRLTTYSTLLIEFSMATLVWFRPLRKYVLAGGLAMHSFIEYTMNIPLFAFAMCSMYVCYFDGEEVAAWWDRLKLRFGKKPSGLLPEGGPSPDQSSP